MKGLPLSDRDLPASLRVALVVDRDFGVRVRDLATAMPVWICDAPANRSVVEALWATRKAAGRFGITTFKTGPGQDVEDLVLEQLPVMDLHFGEYSQDPPWAELEVHGLRPTEAIRAALADLGFQVSTEFQGGFMATRVRGATAHSRDPA